MTPPDVQVTVSYGPATPQQAASWRRLWDLIMAGVENQSASAPNECAAQPETATPPTARPEASDGPP
jgi:hypothetical protein